MTTVASDDSSIEVPNPLEHKLYDSWQTALADGYHGIAKALRDLLGQVLESKVEQYLRTCRYHEAIECSLWLLKTTPSSRLGYLYFGDTYFRLGAYAFALEHYRFCTTLFPDAHVFQERIRRTEEYIRKQRDPILRLPGELIVRIFEYIPEQRIQALAVSRVWRQSIQELPVWSKVVILKDLLPFDDAPYRAYERGLKHVLKPQLRDLTWKTCYSVDAVCYTLIEAGCTNLRKMDFTTELPLRISDLSQESVCTTIIHLGAHLKELTLRTAFQPRNALRRLIASLPQLESFTCNNSFYDIEQPPLYTDESLPQGPLKLKHLRLLGMTWPLEEIEYLPGMTPELVSLIVEQRPTRDHQRGSDAVQAFLEHCPKLETLIWMREASSFLGTLEWCSHTRPNASMRSGLRHFVLDRRINLPDDFVHGIMSQSQDTLEMLYCGSQIGDNPRHLSPALVFSQLRWVSLNIDLLPALGSFRHLLSSSPLLEEVRLRNFDLIPGDMRELARLPKLHTLVLDACASGQDSLLELFQGIVASGSPLSMLEITDFMIVDALNEEVFAALAQITSLTRLVMSIEEVERYEDICLHAFIDAARTSGIAKNLRYLDLFSDIEYGDKHLVYSSIYCVFPEAHVV
ncbi:hypothetical protein BCR43DRAFT_567145 [Syncephalastrum racemosum]|uniref:Uncharacterized protein n=1 Tax=Syncephalastrum racemosum TaxID=13706 RepID=A0A1X2GZH4_SYNRA|nr:hypothetical protein BCR43DRAFT_567145 [Syncephalastrum racemosum]